MDQNTWDKFGESVSLKPHHIEQSRDCRLIDILILILISRDWIIRLVPLFSGRWRNCPEKSENSMSNLRARADDHKNKSRGVSSLLTNDQIRLTFCDNLRTV